MMLQELNGPLNGLSLRKDRLYSTSPFPFGCCTLLSKHNKNVLSWDEKYNQYFFQYIISIIYTKICKYLVLIIRLHTKLLMRKSLFRKNICTKTFAKYRNEAILYSSSYVSWWRHYHVTRTNEMIFENSLPRSP